MESLTHIYKYMLGEMREIIEQQNQVVGKVQSGAAAAAGAAQSENSEELEKEREKFTEAAIRLGRERQAFLTEREAFEREKHAILKSIDEISSKQKLSCAAMKSPDADAEAALMATPGWIKERQLSQQQVGNSKNLPTGNNNILSSSNNNNNAKSFPASSNNNNKKKKIETPFKSPLYSRYFMPNVDDEEDQQSEGTTINNLENIVAANQENWINKENSWVVDENETFWIVKSEWKK